jgi:flagellar basal-body rod protein FlgF
MDSPGYIVLSRLAAQLRATNVLANNIANADTPGYRAERPVFAQVLERQRDGAGAGPGDRAVAYALDRATWRDTAPGPVSTTGNPLDVAIRGDGFFAVETPRGERYTRAGRFQLDGQRRIADADGNLVLDARGTPIQLAGNDSRIEVQGDGTVRSENGALGRLRVVRFEDPQAMRPEGSRLFAAGEDAAPEAMERPNLVQGAVEGSNVSAIQEITRLTMEQRGFEFTAQFAEREGERLQTAVDRILRRR